MERKELVQAIANDHSLSLPLKIIRSLRLQCWRGPYGPVDISNQAIKTAMEAALEVLLVAFPNTHPLEVVELTKLAYLNFPDPDIAPDIYREWLEATQAPSFADPDDLTHVFFEPESEEVPEPEDLEEALNNIARDEYLKQILEEDGDDEPAIAVTHPVKKDLSGPREIHWVSPEGGNYTFEYQTQLMINDCDNPHAWAEYSTWRPDIKRAALDWASENPSPEENLERAAIFRDNVMQAVGLDPRAHDSILWSVLSNCPKPE